MKHLLIIGARGWGREVYACAIGTKAYRDGEYDVKGFLDSKADAFEGLKGNFPPIICAPENYEIQPDDVFFVAMGEPKWRRYYAEMMQAKGAEFISIIDEHDEVMGEVVEAFVVEKEPISDKEIMDIIRPQLENYKWPKKIVRVDAIPKTSSGKIQRLQLKENN